MPQGPLAAVTTTSSATPHISLTPYVDPQRAQFGAQVHGKYYESTYAARTFTGANVTGATLSAALATTYVGLCLSNPAASTVNLVVQRVTGQIIVAPAAVLSLGLIASYSAAGVVTHTTALTTYSNKLGNAAVAQGLVDAACTIVGTPAWFYRSFANIVANDLGGFIFDVDGALVVPPGGWVAVGANVAGPTAGFVGSFEWEELAP